MSWQMVALQLTYPLPTNTAPFNGPAVLCEDPFSGGQAFLLFQQCCEDRRDAAHTVIDSSKPSEKVATKGFHHWMVASMAPFPHISITMTCVPKNSFMFEKISPSNWQTKWFPPGGSKHQRVAVEKTLWFVEATASVDPMAPQVQHRPSGPSARI